MNKQLLKKKKTAVARLAKAAKAVLAANEKLDELRTPLIEADMPPFDRTSSRYLVVEAKKFLAYVGEFYEV